MKEKPTSQIGAACLYTTTLLRTARLHKRTVPSREDESNRRLSGENDNE